RRRLRDRACQPHVPGRSAPDRDAAHRRMHARGEERCSGDSLRAPYGDRGRVMMWILIAAAAASAVTHIYAEYAGRRRVVYIAKPLTTTLLIVAAALAHGDPAYQRPILAGLLFSLAGDIFLMLPRDHFIAGLISFLIAHIAFLNGTRLGQRPLLALPLLLAALAVLTLLWSRLGPLRIPVVVYVAALTTMAWQALVRAAAMPSAFTMMAAIGACLFVVSDGVLAIDRFRIRFRAAQAVIMSTYVAAQALIAISVWQNV